MLFYFLTTYKEFLFIYRIFGLATNYWYHFKTILFYLSFQIALIFFASYVILLSAAHDILTEQESSTPVEISTTVPR